MKRNNAVIAALAGMLAVADGVADEANPGEVVLEEVAGRMAETCFEYADQNQLPPLSIAIVDRAGLPVHLQRQPGASGTTAEVALLKAQTSARTQYPTAELATEDGAARDLYVLMKLTQIAGGVPIKVKDELIGAVGVSGALPDSDALCAGQAVAVLTTPKDS